MGKSDIFCHHEGIEKNRVSFGPFPILDALTVPKSMESPQPLFPRVSMRWYFVVATIVAAVIVWVSSWEDSQTTLIITSGLLALACCIFLLASATFFLFAYTLGAVEKILFQADQKLESPFAHEAMPPQIIPPSSNE